MPFLAVSLAYAVAALLRLASSAAVAADGRRAALASLVVLGLMAGLRWGTARVHRGMVLLLVWLVLTEAVLQPLSWLYPLPGLNFAAHVPYGRVHWTAEGRTSSVMNRWGWHYPDVHLGDERDADSRRVVLVGDSFIEALQVAPRKHMGVVLEGLLDASGRPSQVLAAGRSGWGPGHYRELVTYAIDRFAPDEVVVFVFLGNDFVDATLALAEPSGRTAGDGIYYLLHDDGALTLHPDSLPLTQRVRRELAANHDSLFVQLPVIAESHYVTGKLVDTVIRRVGDRLRRPEPAAAADPWARIGLMDVFFQSDVPPEAAHGFEVVTALLAKIHDEGAARGVTVRFVTIPIFSDAFYRQTGADWHTREGELDLLQPEERLLAAATTADLPLLAMGHTLKADGYDVEQVRALYIRDGIGHLSEAGHQAFAQAVFHHFYQSASGERAAAGRDEP